MQKKPMGNRTMAPPVVALCSILLLSFLGSCASPVHVPPPEKVSRFPAPQDTLPPVSPQMSSGPAGGAANNQEVTDLERLTRLWQKRTGEGTTADYPIGPGDVLEIAVPAMKE